MLHDGPTVRPSKLLISPLDDDHPAFRYFHYVLVWKGKSDYVVMDLTEMRVFDEQGESEWWSNVRGTDEVERFCMNLAQAIKVAETLFEKLKVNGYSVNDVLKMDEEDWQ